MNVNSVIRILHVVNSMNIGGAETMIMNLYRKIDRTKVQFDFMVHSNEKAAYDDEILALGGRIFRIPRCRGINIVDYVRQWSKFFSMHNEISIVHGHMGSSAAIYLYIANRRGRHTIAHSHSTNAGNTLFYIISYPTRYIAQLLFACSKKAGESRYGQKKWKEKNGIILKNGIDADKFTFRAEIRQKYRDEYNINGKFVIGHVGRFNTPKNHEYIIDIFYELQKIKPKSVLMLIGIGNLQEKIRNKVRSLNIEDKVIFMGLRKDVPDCMMAMDVFLFPSRYEGLPVTVIEAQAVGLQCYISDTITKEVIISDRVTCGNIHDNPHIWAKKLAHMQSENRETANESIFKNGYDVKKNAEWLSDFYIRMTEH